MTMPRTFVFILRLGCIVCLGAEALRATGQTPRREFLARSVSSAVVGIGGMGSGLVDPSVANAASGLVFYSSDSGKQFQYADAKIGDGTPKTVGDEVTINYVLSSTGLSNGVKIYSTADPGGVPYTWVLGDKSTIPGLEQAIAGGDGVPPMRPGGIRRVIIQQGGGGYDRNECAEGKGPGPIPRGETYQRFKNVFCNPTRPDAPELVLDVKLLVATE